MDVDISTRALLVSTKVRVWTGEKRDRPMSREICTMNYADLRIMPTNRRETAAMAAIAAVDAA